MSDRSERIAEIQELLRTGASSTTSDGTTVSYDFAALRFELRELMAEDPDHRGRRPVISSINLSGF